MVGYRKHGQRPRTFTATLLLNGTVLVAGGSKGGAIADAELYDPASGTWSPTAPLPVAVRNHTATLLSNGAVLVTGGVSTAFYANTEIYNPKKGTRTSTGSLNTPRSSHTATLLPNRRVLIAGGASTTSVLASAELGVRVR